MKQQGKKKYRVLLHDVEIVAGSIEVEAANPNQAIEIATNDLMAVSWMDAPSLEGEIRVHGVIELDEDGEKGPVFTF